jgi:hypothetical protein
VLLLWGFVASLAESPAVQSAWTAGAVSTALKIAAARGSSVETASHRPAWIPPIAVKRHCAKGLRHDGESASSGPLEEHPCVESVPTEIAILPPHDAVATILFRIIRLAPATSNVPQEHLGSLIAALRAIAPGGSARASSPHGQALLRIRTAVEQ